MSQHDGLSAAAVPGVGYSYNVPGLFAQDEFSPTTWLKLAGSARVDSNNKYGTFFSPRFSALIRQPSGDWSLRASAGGGYAALTPFVDEVEATGLGSLLPLRGLHAERARSAARAGAEVLIHYDAGRSHLQCRHPCRALEEFQSVQTHLLKIRH